MNESISQQIIESAKMMVEPEYITDGKTDVIHIAPEAITAEDLGPIEYATFAKKKRVVSKKTAKKKKVVNTIAKQSRRTNRK